VTWAQAVVPELPDLQENSSLTQALNETARSGEWVGQVLKYIKANSNVVCSVKFRKVGVGFHKTCTYRASGEAMLCEVERWPRNVHNSSVVAA